jgi:hypothetical protein
VQVLTITATAFPSRPPVPRSWDLPLAPFLAYSRLVLLSVPSSPGTIASSVRGSRGLPSRIVVIAPGSLQSLSRRIIAHPRDFAKALAERPRLLTVGSERVLDTRFDGGDRQKRYQELGGATHLFVDVYETALIR